MKQTFAQKLIAKLKLYKHISLSAKLGMFVLLFLVGFIVAIFMVFNRGQDDYDPLLEAIGRQRAIISELVLGVHILQHINNEDAYNSVSDSIGHSVMKFKKSYEVIRNGGLLPRLDESEAIYIDPDIVARVEVDEKYLDIMNELEDKYKLFSQKFYTLGKQDFYIKTIDSTGYKKERNKIGRVVYEILRVKLGDKDGNGIRKNNGIGQLHKALFNRVKEFQDQSADMSKYKDILLYVFILGIFVLIIVVSRVYIIHPISEISYQIKQVASGDLSIRLDDSSRDEIGQMAGYMNELIRNLEKAAEFAGKIGDGEFEHKFEALGDKDNLGSSLVNMRDKLVQFAQEDKIRNWSTQGMAKFAEVLQSDKSDINRFYENIVISLVKYLEANQGAIYVLNDEEGGIKNRTLTMKACYAWDRVKDFSADIMVGEGLVGQCVLEREHIYFTDIPDEFVKITSGLGEANPNSVLISPLIVNEEIMGVLELCSFKKFESHQIEFVQKLGEAIAGSISGLKVAEKTKRLLDESQELGEAMKGQEEELRQNQEEMLATQEEMGRKIQALEEELTKYRKA